MACRPYNTGRCLLLRLFNPSKLWGSLQYLFHSNNFRNDKKKAKKSFEYSREMLIFDYRRR